MTGGLLFLYKGLMDRATAQVDQCENTLAEIRESENWRPRAGRSGSLLTAFEMRSQ